MLSPWGPREADLGKFSKRILDGGGGGLWIGDKNELLAEADEQLSLPDEDIKLEFVRRFIDCKHGYCDCATGDGRIFAGKGMNIERPDLQIAILDRSFSAPGNLRATAFVQSPRERG